MGMRHIWPLATLGLIWVVVRQERCRMRERQRRVLRTLEEQNQLLREIRDSLKTRPGAS